jgi:hypothetical protein
VATEEVEGLVVTVLALHGDDGVAGLELALVVVGLLLGDAQADQGADQSADDPAADQPHQCPGRQAAHRRPGQHAEAGGLGHVGRRVLGGRGGRVADGDADLLVAEAGPAQLDQGPLGPVAVVEKGDGSGSQHARHGCSPF